MTLPIVSYIRAVAREHGYAVGVHGSITRDLDLIAVPWVEECSPAEKLVEALEAELHLVATRKNVEKPHGRRGYILHGARWRNGDSHQPIDLSIMPRREALRVPD